MVKAQKLSQFLFFCVVRETTTKTLFSEKNRKFQQSQRLGDGCGAVILWEEEGWISPFLLPGKRSQQPPSAHQSFTLSPGSPVSCPFVLCLCLPRLLAPSLLFFFLFCFFYFFFPPILSYSPQIVSVKWGGVDVVGG